LYNFCYFFKESNAQQNIYSVVHKFFNVLKIYFLCFFVIVIALSCGIRYPSSISMSNNNIISCSGVARNNIRLQRPHELSVSFQSCSIYQESVIYDALQREDFKRFFGLQRVVVTSNGPYDVLIKNTSDVLDNNPNSIGLFVNHTRIIYVRGDKINSSEQLQSVVLHEFGHWFGMDHICSSEQDRTRMGISPLQCDNRSIMNSDIGINDLKRFDASAINEQELNRARNCLKTLN